MNRDTPLHERLYGPAAALGSPARDALEPSASDQRGGPAPLGFAQQRIWFYDQLYPGDPVYHGAEAFRLRGPLDVAALRGALDTIVRRQPGLRTRIVPIDDVPMQIAGDATAFPFETVNAAGVEEALARCAGAARQPFDLAGDAPPTRALLARLASDDHVLALVFHHAIWDGASMGIIYEDLAALTGAPAAQRERRAGAVTPAAYARWQRRVFSEDALAKQRAFWRARLAGIAPLALPTDFPRPPQRSQRGARIWETSVLDRAALAALRALAHQHGTTLFAALLTGYAAALHAAAAQDAFAVGFPIAGRDARLDGVVGCFINMLVLRADFSAAPTFAQALGRVRDALAEAYDNRDIPFEQIVKAAGAKRDLSRLPLADVMLNVRTLRTPSLAVAELEVEALQLDYGIANYDQTFDLAERATGLDARLQFNTDVFEAETARAFVRSFGALLRAATAAPDRAVAALPQG